MNYKIFPPENLPESTIKLPLSKSESARVLIISALSGSQASSHCDVAGCDDTNALLYGLSKLSGTVNIGAAGTAMRFLTAYYAATSGSDVILTGSERMLQRPISPLVEALRQAGADIEYVAGNGFPPLRIRGRKLTGGDLTINSGVSSQYISALLMIAPVCAKGINLTLEGDVVSMPYIHMTLELMAKCGVKADIDGRTIRVSAGNYSPRVDMEIGADWSAASYWYEIQALTCGWTTLIGLHEYSPQGDKAIVSLFRQLGVNSSFDSTSAQVELEASPELSPRFVANMENTPDVAQTFAVTCAMLGVPFHLTGLRSLRIKETDRISALATELKKVGVVIDIEGDESISWDGIRRPISKVPQFDTYQDHRMAMSFAPVAIYIPGIVIRDVEVVNKSYPNYWNHLRDAGFIIEAVVDKSEDNSDVVH